MPNSVRNIKTTIDEVTVAKSYSFGRHSHSDTNASTVGLGAELTQETHEGTRPVAFLTEL